MYNTLWDPNDDKERLFEKFTKYYGEFSDDVREDMQSRNVQIPTSVYDVLYPEARENLLSKNVPKNTDIIEDTEVYRQAALAKIVPAISDIKELSETYRAAQLTRNIISETSVLEISKKYRLEQLAKNETISTEPHLKKSKDFREQMLSKNVPLESDLEADTASLRDDQLAKNVSNTSDVIEDTQDFRDGQLSKNVSSESDLETDSVPFREDGLSNNVPSESDLEADTASLRDDQLAKNVPSESDLEADTASLRDDQLAKNVPSESDLETDSVPFREDGLSNNVPSESDLETDSAPFREDGLSNNVPSESDLEADTASLRDDQLAKNVPSESDLETDSIPFREDDLSNNVPSESDLETDSIPFRQDGLSNNVPSESDLETDSIPFREDDLSNNVPSESDLETDSVPFREDDLSNNVPSESDLETDSVPFREDDLSNNVPSESDLETDSVPFREDDLSNNVPSESDLETDSVPFREDDLSNNVPSESDLETDSSPYREALLAFNVGAVSDILGDSDPYRLEQMSSNVSSISNILSDSEQARKEQLSKNLQGGLFGVNVEGFGTQAFIGVSRNFAFGALVRTALLARNDYRPGMFGSEGTQYRDRETDKDKIEESLFVSDDGVSTTRSKIQDMHLRNGQNSIGYRAWLQAGNPAGSMLDLDGSSVNVAAKFKSSTINNIGDEPQADDLLAKSYAGNPLGDRGDGEEEFASGPRSIKKVIDRIANDSTVRYAQNYKIGQREFITGVRPNGAPKIRKQRYSVSNLYAPAEAGELMFGITNYAIENEAGQETQLRTMYFPPYIKSFQENEEANWNETNMLGRPEAIYTYNNARRSGSINFFVLTDFAQEVELGLTDTPSVSELLQSLQNGGGDPVMGTLKYDFEKEGIFTDLSDDDREKIKGVDQDVAAQAALEKLISKDNQSIADIEASYDTPEASVASALFNGNLMMQIDRETKINPIRERIESNKLILIKISKSIEEKRVTAGKDAEGNIVEKTRFSENYKDGGNIYNPSNLLNYTQPPNADSEITSIRNVESVLDDMKKNLGFQPAFFSGDKADFRRRMSFLSKLTRPRENNGQNKKVGFSFTTPPVAHLRLGDWLDHDCIVNSISKDYSDTVWCLQRGKVQPLWALVTVAFTIIGPYGTYKKGDNNSYRPLTATDVGGYYSQRKVW